MDLVARILSHQANNEDKLNQHFRAARQEVDWQHWKKVVPVDYPPESLEWARSKKLFVPMQKMNAEGLSRRKTMLASQNNREAEDR